jgi:hypothetical protein
MVYLLLICKFLMSLQYFFNTSLAEYRAYRSTCQCEMLDIDIVAGYWATKSGADREVGVISSSLTHKRDLCNWFSWLDLYFLKECNTLICRMSKQCQSYYG